MITCVARPLGRGFALNSYSFASGLVRLTSTRNCAAFCATFGLTRGRSLRAPPVTRSCGWVGVVLRAEDALQRMATGAVSQELLVAVASGKALEPFTVGQLQVDVAGTIEFEIGRCIAAGGNLNAFRPFQDVANSADRDSVL